MSVDIRHFPFSSIYRHRGYRKSVHCQDLLEVRLHSPEAIFKIAKNPSKQLLSFFSNYFFNDFLFKVIIFSAQLRLDLGIIRNANHSMLDKADYKHACFIKSIRIND